MVKLNIAYRSCKANGRVKQDCEKAAIPPNVVPSLETPPGTPMATRLDGMNQRAPRLRSEDDKIAAVSDPDSPDYDPDSSDFDPDYADERKRNCGTPNITIS